ncbi:MAG: NADH-quinone oxidoreductase subunit F, partial [Acidimicrobiia bacterium]|nr:NADH-quinone oxidoreductase subunit F [Acidimicrobiia bacterium]
NNMVGKNICGSAFSVDITLTWGAGAYIVGEETALIESLEGERGMPRLKPPFFPAVKGLYMQPTIVNNVETLANVPYIVTSGGSEFKSIGAPTSTGMRMFAVSGHVKKPGVFEVPNGVTTFRMLFEAPEYCGGVREGRSVKAFIPGGASAMWFFPEHLDMALDKPTVDKAGSMLGSGAIVVMDDTTDMVAACWRIVRFFARESCGKCTPCREGTTWLERVLKRILDGHGRPEDIDLLMEVSESISPGIAWPPRQTTICPLGPSAVSPIASAVRRFRHEFDHYIAHGRPIDGVESPFAVAAASHA